ncbi:hypothetical protein CY34DRAFT_104520 [Suillus luteus UH-Slu-Lm8-n1]|uniref:Uncharacterized protein n=1 Tax=Suillus luteus UH-Slu-Lm8-n1 TaxID=930992 RepID=A0A0D0BNN1_9AGAM|nr:hypothetical protein CY34DRAFT_104520 [Suillus luteus UH-Slu-Lm8-n1]
MPTRQTLVRYSIPLLRNTFDRSVGNPPHLGIIDTLLFWVVLETKYVNFHRIYKVVLPQTAHDLGPGHKGYRGIRAISQAQTQDQAELCGIGTQIINPERQRWSGSSSLCDPPPLRNADQANSTLLGHPLLGGVHSNVSSGIGLSDGKAEHRNMKSQSLPALLSAAPCPYHRLSSTALATAETAMETAAVEEYMNDYESKSPVFPLRAMLDSSRADIYFMQYPALQHR